uniref:Uncharacterized protein n=1 Tax=Glossina palpalis gambiensis TaxID=67801 RepID=A0A1B0AV15_9MUSC
MSVCFLRKDNKNKTLLFKRQQSSSKLLLVFALAMLVMQHFMLVSGNTPKGLRTHLRSAKLSSVHSLPEINADRTAGKYDTSLDSNKIDKKGYFSSSLCAVSAPKCANE